MSVHGCKGLGTDVTCWPVYLYGLPVTEWRGVMRLWLVWWAGTGAGLSTYTLRWGGQVCGCACCSLGDAIGNSQPLSLQSVVAEDYRAGALSARRLTYTSGRRGEAGALEYARRKRVGVTILARVLLFRSGWLRQCRGARMGVIVLEAWRQPPSNVFKGEEMMDRFLAWFGLARRGEVKRLECEMETLTTTLVEKEGVIERLEDELLFRRRFFDDTALMDHDLKDIHSRLDGMLA